MENKLLELSEFNTYNVLAISLPLMNIESILTILVLVSALVYNIKKIMTKNG